MHNFQKFGFSLFPLSLLALVFSTSWAPDVHGQAQIGFRNNSATAISNCLTGTRLATGPTFQVGLFAGPIGAPESALSQVAVTTCTQPGTFNGGDVALPGFAPGQAVLLQVRAWETAFGNTYQEAFYAPFSTAAGRSALTGKSLLFQAVLPSPGFPPPSLPTLGFRSFTVCTVISNLPPSVIVTHPSNRAEFEENQIAVLAATASDPGGAIAGVRFYLRRAHDIGAPEEFVGTDLEEPYEMTTGPLKVGVYFVTAVARDNQGAEAQSLPVELIVSSPPVMSIARAGSDVTICWPPTVTTYRLEETSSLARPMVWAPIPGLITPDHTPGIGHCVVLKISPGPRFFRLARPEDP